MRFCGKSDIHSGGAWENYVLLSSKLTKRDWTTAKRVARECQLTNNILNPHFLHNEA